MTADTKSEVERTFEEYHAKIVALMSKHDTIPPPPDSSDKVAHHRSRRRRALIVEQTLALAILIGKHPEGVKAGTLAKESGIEKRKLGVPLKKATELHLAHMKGTRGGAIYLPA
jgi:hypothetical protein